MAPEFWVVIMPEKEDMVMLQFSVETHKNATVGEFVKLQVPENPGIIRQLCLGVGAVGCKIDGSVAFRDNKRRIWSKRRGILRLGAKAEQNQPCKHHNRHHCTQSKPADTKAPH